MSSSSLLKKIEQEALSLSRQERAFLADRLLSSLDGDALTEVDAAWIAEAERRYQEYKKGKRPGLGMRDVFAEVDRILK
jgi:putative addiction module component (TIGR02574 family)